MPLSTIESSKERTKESRIVTSWLLQMSMPSELYRQSPISLTSEMARFRQPKALRHHSGGSRRITPSIFTSELSDR